MLAFKHKCWRAPSFNICQHIERNYYRRSIWKRNKLEDNETKKDNHIKKGLVKFHFKNENQRDCSLLCHIPAKNWVKYVATSGWLDGSGWMKTDNSAYPAFSSDVSIAL